MECLRGRATTKVASVDFGGVPLKRMFISMMLPRGPPSSFGAKELEQVSWVHEPKERPAYEILRSLIWELNSVKKRTGPSGRDSRVRKAQRETYLANQRVARYTRWERKRHPTASAE